MSLALQLGLVICCSIRWILLIFMRPNADEVELLYEIMSVTGEATVMLMVCLNYLQSIGMIQMERIPPLAIFVFALLIVGGNLGAQVWLLPISRLFWQIASALLTQVQAIVLNRILAIVGPLHDKLMALSPFYRHCVEALMQRWIG